MKKSSFLTALPILASLLVSAPIAHAATLASNLSGRILLQVESHGEAWYVYPNDLKRYFLGRPADAFNIMRSLGLGVSNANLVKIRRLELNVSGADSDGDGLSDMFETAIGTDPLKADTDGDGFDDKTEVMNGYNPNGAGKSVFNASFASTMRGKILLQVDSHGEAWYVNPTNDTAYFLGRPEQAFEVMRAFGLGITNTNLNLIVSSTGTASVSTAPVSGGVSVGVTY